jgi:hypothetical protein
MNGNDSVFTTNKLEDKFIGKELGYMKDELNGLIIKEAYFLGIKKYGFHYHSLARHWDNGHYLDKDNNLITRSTFAGIQRDSLTFEEIIKLAQGSTLIKDIPLRFYKSLKNLSINIDSTHVSITRSLDKLLINNNYIPLNLVLPPKINNSFLQYLKRKILILINSILNYFI